jgi:hypothetical protein
VVGPRKRPERLLPICPNITACAQAAINLDVESLAAAILTSAVGATDIPSALAHSTARAERRAAKTQSRQEKRGPERVVSESRRSRASPENLFSLGVFASWRLSLFAGAPR